MTKFKVFVVFFFSAIIVCVNGIMNCENNSSQYCVVIRGINSLGNIAEKYQTGLDNQVPFPLLSKAIIEIDEHMGDYQGTAKNNMNSLRSLNYGLEDTYHECLSPVYNWCISSNITFQLYITSITNKEISDKTKKQLINILTNKIKDGYEKMMLSLSKLNKLISETTSIKNLLGKINSDLELDFSPKGYYGKKKQELDNAIGHRQKRELMVNILDWLKVLVNAAKAVIHLVHQATGWALGLGDALIGAGVPRNVVDMKQEPKYDESMKIIETLYTVLNNKVSEAERYAEEAHIAFMEDSNNLDALHKVLIGGNDTFTLPLNTDLQNSIVEALKDVRAKCLTNTNLHTNPNDSNVISR